MGLLADELTTEIEVAHNNVVALEHALDLLADLREIKRTVGLVEADMVEFVADLLPRGGRVEGFGHVEVKRGKDRTSWQHDDLYRVVLARARDERMIDPETGEAEDLGEAALRVFRACAGNPAYWRVGALRDRGIDPDEYCESKPGKVSVILP